MANQGLREKLTELLREMSGTDLGKDEEVIVRSAARRVPANASEELMVIALIDALDEEERQLPPPENIMVNDPDNFDQILDAIAENYMGIPTRIAGTRADLSVGREEDDFDEFGKNYRGEDRSGDDGEETFNILDGIHDDIPYHRDATEVPGLPRTRHESLAR